MCNLAVYKATIRRILFILSAAFLSFTPCLYGCRGQILYQIPPSIVLHNTDTLYASSSKNLLHFSGSCMLSTMEVTFSGTPNQGQWDESESIQVHGINQSQMRLLESIIIN